jgi:MFS family permease
MGWTNPWVLAGLIGGVALLVVFCVVEARIDDPMFDLSLFRIKAFAAGNLAGLLASVSRGGLQFLLIIWLQGIWLPLHGYSFSSTPLWAGIYLLPLTVAFLVVGPLSGYYSDRFGARTFATGGLVLVAGSFLGLMLLPTDFNYWAFAGLLMLNGIGSGLFSAPNTTAIMNSVPANRRGAASGMRATFFNSGTSLSIGVFFTLMIIGLAQTLPRALTDGLQAHGVSHAVASGIGHQPPVGSLFAAFLGYNPLGTTLGALPASATNGADLHTLTSKEFFPQLISSPFHHALLLVFSVAILLSLIGAAASLFRGARYIHAEPDAGAVSEAAGDRMARFGEPTAGRQRAPRLADTG